MDTVVACLTPPGKGAIAVLAVRGPRAWSIACAAFRPRGKKELPEAAPAGWFGVGFMGSGGEDEVVLACLAEDRVEVHCHGGPQVVRMLERTLEERGARPVAWPEMVEAEEGPERAHVLDLLTRAPTLRTANILHEQLHGARRTERFERLRSLGVHLVEPWRVVLAGAPNVGKSSLANALAGYERCVTAPTPGTTRDLVGIRVALDGWPVELTDTAGLRAGEEALEEEGIARARRTLAEADLVVWVLDGAADPVRPEPDLAGSLRVINKTDLAPAWDWANEPEALLVSAVTGAGVPDLIAAIVGRLVPEVPEPGEAVPLGEMVG